MTPVEPPPTGARRARRPRARHGWDGVEHGVEDLEHRAGAMATAAVHGGGDAPGRGVELLGRVGLVAYGVVHLLVAGLGVELALGLGNTEVDQNGALAEVAAVGVVGTLILVVFVAGLLAFAAWQVCAASVGFRWVDGSERFRKRVGAVAKTIAVVAVAVVAVRFVVGNPVSSGRAGPQLLVTSLLALPAGRLLVAAVAVTVVVVACSMVYTGFARSFLGDLVGTVPPRTRHVAAFLGAYGNLARAVAFGAVGVLFALAAWRGDPSRVGGVDLAIRTLADEWKGIAPTLVVSVGFAAFGVYCFLDARYRRA